MGTLLIVSLIVLLFAALPLRWRHYRKSLLPAGGVGLLLTIVIVLVLLGRL